MQVDADVDSALLLDWLLNVPMPRQVPQGLQGMAALQRRIALSVWHSLLGDTTMSLFPASSSCCSGGFQTRNKLGSLPQRPSETVLCAWFEAAFGRLCRLGMQLMMLVPHMLASPQGIASLQGACWKTFARAGTSEPHQVLGALARP